MTKVALGLCTLVKAYVHEVNRAYTGMFLRTQLGFQKHMKDKFSTIMGRFGMNPTSSVSHSKPHFFNYKKPYMVDFQNTQKSHEKSLRFTRK